VQFAHNARYVTGIRSFNEKFWINEKGIKAEARSSLCRAAM